MKIKHSAGEVVWPTPPTEVWLQGE
jgi:hypothetical protein